MRTTRGILRGGGRILAVTLSMVAATALAAPSVQTQVASSRFAVTVNVVRACSVSVTADEVPVSSSQAGRQSVRLSCKPGEHASMPLSALTGAPISARIPGRSAPAVVSTVLDGGAVLQIDF